MKELFIILFFIPNIVLSQSEVTLDNNKFNAFLDFANSSVNGSSTNEAIFLGKKILTNKVLFKNNFIPKQGELTKFEDEEFFYNKKNDTYVHFISSPMISFYMGIDGIGSFKALILITSKDKDFNKKNNVVKIETRLAFLGRYADDSKLEEITTKITSSVVEYYFNKCAQLSYAGAYQNGTFLGDTFENIFSYDIMGKGLLQDGAIKEEEKELCVSNCETCMLEFNLGYTNNGDGLGGDWSHFLIIRLEDKVKNYFVEFREEANKNIFESGFVINDYKGIDGNNLDLREINNYDLKAMVNFFIEDYNRSSNKVSNKKSYPKVYNEKQIKATFEDLEGDKIAESYGINNDSVIVIKVDPEKWANASEEKRWYIIYHELGHDILNLDHGEGGKMMFNFADKEYSWDDFIEDKQYMFDKN